MCVELHHIEEVARMLPIHGGDQFAAVDILLGYDGNFYIGLQGLARCVRQRCVADRLNGASHDEVDFDLDFDVATTYEQFGFAGAGRRHGASLKAAGLQARGPIGGWLH